MYFTTELLIYYMPQHATLQSFIEMVKRDGFMAQCDVSLKD